MVTPAQRHLKAQPTQWTDWEPVPGFDFEHILYDRRKRTRGGGVARITMNRVERRNSLTAEVFEELNTAIGHANRDNSVGVTVLTHNGPHFGVGGDVSWEVEMERGSFRVSDDVIRESKKPVIAAVRGYLIGGSHHMAYTCDFTIAGESAIFGQNGPRVGAPASGFVVAYSAHVVGQKLAREIWMRCRQYTAQEALHMGLCNVVVQDRLVDAEVERWCDELLDLVPYCLAGIRQSFEGVDMPLRYTDNFFDMISPNYMSSPEREEAGLAFFEKRSANFWTEEMVSKRNL